jgi:opacity protein-like surface antigen
MMRRLIPGLVVAIAVVMAAPAVAGEVTVAELVADGAAYAGEEVVVIGELVGDYGSRRTGFTWTQLNGDSYISSPVADGGGLSGANIGIGLRIPTGLVTGLDAPGRYRTVGPIVQVTGEWKYHDPDRQGESYLDAASIEIVEPGRALSEAPIWWMYGVGLVLLATTAALMRLYTRRRDAA